MRRLIIAIMAAALLAGCRTPKDIDYFQDAYNHAVIDVESPYQVKVQPGDKLRILVTTQDPRLDYIFNLQQPLGNATSGYGGAVASSVLGYTVEEDGCIDFPMLGKLRIAGLNRRQVADLIERELRGREMVKDPVVTIDYLNLGVCVLGGVASPGHFKINTDRYTVLDAISAAGDLKITGERSNVKVIRQTPGRQEVYVLDLLDAEQFYSSPGYYLQQGDVVYVEPNAKAKRSATPLGNTLYQSSFWISVASVAISLAVLISNI